jgi:hypothetical protein
MVSFDMRSLSRQAMLTGFAATARFKMIWITGLLAELKAGIHCMRTL